MRDCCKAGGLITGLRAFCLVASADEFSIMRSDILFCRSLGAHGVVIGLLNSDGSVDVARTKELVELARPMKVTFHRAIDMAKDMKESCEKVVETGCDTILTSGGMQDAIAGSSCIKVRSDQHGMVATQTDISLRGFVPFSVVIPVSRRCQQRTYLDHGWRWSD
jgi:hypothetical protein